MARWAYNAGVHGGEHGGIQAAYELLERLANVRLHGQVDVLPVCNPLAYAAGTRFTPGSDRDMARAFTPARPADLTEAAEWVASLGFPFVIKRGTPETLAHHIASRLRPEQRTATLELGGGIAS